MDYYLLAFMLIVLIGSIIIYIYYLKEKNEQLTSIQRGVCPRCKKSSIILADQRSSGCSGPKLLSFECLECEYANSFAIKSDHECEL